MNDWIVRRAGKHDEEMVLELVARLVAFGPPPWREPAAMIAVDQRNIKAAIRSTGADPLVLVAARGDVIAGFVHLHSLRDHYRSEVHGHVSDIVVAQSCEGEGIGRLLLDAAQTWALGQGYDWLTLSVFEQNQRAAAMYERAGFGRDVLKLVKPLR